MAISSLGLEAFHAVARTLSFSKAARELGLTQPALSQRVLKLEDELGTRLFVREPSGVRLTEGGARLLRHCQAREALEAETLAEIAPARRARGDGLSGQLRIAGYSSVMRSLVLPRLGRLVARNPDIRLEAFVRELGELPALLRRGQADLIILDRVLEDSDLEARVIGREENVLVQRKGLGEARAQVYLDHDPEDETTRRLFESQGRKLPKGFQRSYLDDVYGLLEGVRLGWGRAVLPRHLVAGSRELEVVAGFRPLRNPVVLHYYRQPYYPRLFEQAVASVCAAPA